MISTTFLKKTFIFLILLSFISCDQEKSMTKYGEKSNDIAFFKKKEARLKKLSELQHEVTQKGGTEKPFNNAYWDYKKPGIYVDIVSGEPLFSSLDKFDSGTGWPSFSRPLVKENIVEKNDYTLVLPRTEVKSRKADSHLGHVFDDGPGPTGKRFCINSASLRFISVEDLKKEGYEKFLKFFKEIENNQ